MDKSEWIVAHENVLAIKNHFVNSGMDPELFEEYEALNVHPSHDHKSKAEHRKALFVLGSAITEGISESHMDSAHRVSLTTQQYADEIDLDSS